MEPLTITTEYNKGFKFERPIGKYGVKEFAYVSKKTLAELGIDPTKGITFAQYQADEKAGEIDEHK